MDGWIRLGRKMADWEWYSDTNVTRLFLHLLIMANFKDASWKGLLIKRGQFVSSRARISAQIGLTEKQIRVAEAKLRDSGSLVVEGASGYCIYTIVKYNEYQTENEIGASKGQAEGKQRASGGQQLKKEKNDKKEKIEDITPTPFPDWLSPVVWVAYLDMRQAKGSPATDHAKTLIIAKLDSWRAKGHDPTEILEKSIRSNWTDVFEPKGNPNENTSRNSQRDLHGNAGQQGGIGKSKWTTAAEQLIAEDLATGRWKDRI